MANGTNVNKFAYAFNKIKPPESGSPEDMAAYNTKINATFEAIYGTIHGYLGMRNLSTAVQKAINSKVDSEDLLGYSTIEQTAESIKLEVGRIDESIANITVMADEISASVVDLEENVSLVQQRADEISSSVADKASVSYVQQTANSLTNQIFSATSGLVSSSQLTQTLNSFVFALKDGTAKGEFEVKIANQPPWNSGGPSYAGAAWKLAGTTRGFLGVGGVNDTIFMVSTDQYLSLDSGSGIDLMVRNYNPWFSLDGPADRIYASRALTVSSDRRLKHDISDLRYYAPLLRKLRPRCYRMQDAEGMWDWGLVAQEVKEALDELGIDDVVLYDGRDPEKLKLCYEQLIAPLIAGWQDHERVIAAQQAEIGDLKTRLTRLEGMIAK